MRLRVFIGLCLASSVALAGNPPAQKTILAESLRNHVQMVALLSHEEGLGSGFFVRIVGGRAYLLTNAHVIPKKIGRVMAAGPGWEAFVRVEAIDSKADLALVSFPASGLMRLAEREFEFEDIVPFELRAAEPEKGEAVALLGFPYGGLPPDGAAMTFGEVTGRDGPLLAIDARATPGNSGGPLLSADGKVLGVLVSGYVGHRYSFVIPVSTVQHFLARAGLGPEVANELSTPRTRKLWPQVEKGLVSIWWERRFIAIGAAIGEVDGGVLVWAPGASACWDVKPTPCEVEIRGDSGVGVRYPVKLIASPRGGRRALLVEAPLGAIPPVAIGPGPAVYTPRMPRPWSFPDESILSKTTGRLEIAFNEKGELVGAPRPTPGNATITSTSGELPPTTLEELRFAPPSQVRVRAGADCQVSLDLGVSPKVASLLVVHTAVTSRPLEVKRTMAIEADQTVVELTLDDCETPGYLALLRFALRPEATPQGAVGWSLALTDWSFREPANAAWPVHVSLRADPRSELDRTEVMKSRRLDPSEVYYTCTDERTMVSARTQKRYQVRAPEQPEREVSVTAEFVKVAPDGSLVRPARELLFNRELRAEPKSAKAPAPSPDTPSSPMTLIQGEGACLAADGSRVENFCSVLGSASKEEHLYSTFEGNLMLTKGSSSKPVSLAPLRGGRRYLGAQATPGGWLVAWLGGIDNQIRATSLKGERVVKTVEYAPKLLDRPESCRLNVDGLVWCERWPNGRPKLTVHGPKGRKLPPSPMGECRLVPTDCGLQPCSQFPARDGRGK